ncbi:MAG: hypothetical protein WC455_09585 [Dehalococcoidia bacterium]|jgi:hypothetical protein
MLTLALVLGALGFVLGALALVLSYSNSVRIGKVDSGCSACYNDIEALAVDIAAMKPEKSETNSDAAMVSFLPQILKVIMQGFMPGVPSRVHALEPQARPLDDPQRDLQETAMLAFMKNPALLAMLLSGGEEE